MNKKGNWTLAAILGVVGIALIIVPILGIMSKWWILLGIVFLVLAFVANSQ